MQTNLYRITHTYNYRPEYDLIIADTKGQDLKHIAGYLCVLIGAYFNKNISPFTHCIADLFIKFYDCRMAKDDEFCVFVSNDKNIINTYQEEEKYYSSFTMSLTKDALKQSPNYRNGLIEYLQERIKTDPDLDCSLFPYPKFYKNGEDFLSLHLLEQVRVFNLTYEQMIVEHKHMRHINKLYGCKSAELEDCRTVLAFVCNVLQKQESTQTNSALVSCINQYLYCISQSKKHQNQVLLKEQQGDISEIPKLLEAIQAREMERQEKFDEFMDNVIHI